MKRFVITGGPGRGKSTLIDILASRGYTVVSEAARMIIEEEQSAGSEALPWKDLATFQTKVVQRQLDLESETVGDVVFFDRGILDGYGYCVQKGMPIPQIILDKIDQVGERYDKIFVLEALPGYKLDKIRFEDEKTATDIHNAIVDAYKKFGYEPILVPAFPPEQRADFIVSNIS